MRFLEKIQTQQKSYFMTQKSKKYLSDVLMAINLIREFTIEINAFNSYEKDRKTQSAVERQLVIIGEA